MNHTTAHVFTTLKSILADLNIAYTTVYLFGSRANGTEKADSDWDFIVVTKSTLSDYERRKLQAQIRILFHNALGAIGIDIIIKSEAVFTQEKTQRNTISYDAVHHGVLV